MKARPDLTRSLRSSLAALAAATLAMTAPASATAANAASGQRTAVGPDHPAARSTIGVRSGQGWRSAPPPAWVEFHAGATGTPGAPGPLAARGGQHALLIDEQQAIDRNDDSGAYLMWRTLITDATGLVSASRVEVSYDPGYQKVLLHSFAVWRDGRRLDRLASARIELLRREAGLENESIDGRKTLLVILDDVRVGDVVEISYSVLGQNPVHGPSHDGSLDTAFEMPVDRLFASVTSRSTRGLHVQAVRTDGIPAIHDEGGVQRWQLERSNVAAIQPEEGTPSDYAVFPRVDYSDDADWHEVAQWGVKLFKVDATLGPDLERRVDGWKASGLEGKALVSAALSLVQDDVRYFSTSLGENSHRPKVPERTWANRFGDCKDKTALLVAILQRLGFDARPALVSSSARNSLRDMLPRHDVFDHAIVRLQLDGRTWWLDGTMTSQSTRLETRAAPSVDWALVAAPETQALEAVRAPTIDDALITYDHVWDTSDLNKPAHLQLTVTVRDAVAESYRGTIASGRLGALVDAIKSHYRTRFQDYRSLGEPVVQDDRAANRLSVHIEGEVPLLGELRDGALAVEVLPLRIMDSLTTPDQLQRSTPWDYDPPQTLSERIHLILPQPPHMETALHREVSDPHFALTLSSSESGHERILEWRFQRHDDVVLPTALAHFRDRVTKARNDNDMSLTEPLFNRDRLIAQATEDQKRIDKDPRMMSGDEAARLATQAYVRQVRDDLILAASGTTSPVGSRTLVDRALQDTVLGDDDTGQADLDRVAGAALAEPSAQYVRGLVLFTSGRFADAEQAFRAGADVTDPVMGPARRWIGVAAYYDGRPSDAVHSFQEAVRDESGDERTITLAWLFVAALHQDRQGEAAIAPFLDGEHDKAGTWSGQLLDAMRAVAEANAKGTPSPADLDNWPPAKALLETMKKDPAMRRERAVQMTYFISQLAVDPTDRAGAASLLQTESNLHSPSLPEDVYARTQRRMAGTKAPADLMDAARKAAAAGDRREAAAILRRAVAASPGDTDALLMLGRIETDQADCKALKHLKRAASLRPDDPVIGVELARALAPCGTQGQAVPMLAHWLADPRTPPAARAEGLALRSMMAIDEYDDKDGNDDQHLSAADDDARSAVRIDAELPVAWLAMYLVHDRQGRHEEALGDVDRMKTAGAPAQDVARYRAMALTGLKRDVEAKAESTNALAIERASLDRQILLQPDLGALWAERADLAVGVRDNASALIDYDKAIAVDKTDPRAWFGRATALWRLDRGPEAVTSCLKGVELSDTLLNRSACAIVYWETGDHARAIKALDHLALHREEMEASGHVYWFAKVGEALLSYGRAKEAAAFLQRAVQGRSNQPYGSLFLHVARAMSGDESGAREALALRPGARMTQWQGHLIDYAAHRLDDEALTRLAAADAPGDAAGQACEATFYVGLRHWLDGDLANGNALLVKAADECPRTFTEAMITRAWFAAGPGAAYQASITAGSKAAAR